MMKPSARMKAIIDQVMSGETIADIGTDHAIIPIYLYKNGISPKVILTDSKEGPLHKARMNLEKFNLLAAISDIRLGDGLSVLKPGEVDTVIIAGMGGLLISDILEREIQKTRTFKRFILQPRTAADELREWLNNNGFSIINEKLSVERGRVCEIITALPGESWPDKEVFCCEMDYEIPPLLFQCKDPLLGLFVDKKIRQAQDISDNVMKSKSKCPTMTPATAENRIHQLLERKAQL